MAFIATLFRFFYAHCLITTVESVFMPELIDILQQITKCYINLHKCHKTV